MRPVANIWASEDNDSTSIYNIRKYMVTKLAMYSTEWKERAEGGVDGGGW